MNEHGIPEPPQERKLAGLPVAFLVAFLVVQLALAHLWFWWIHPRTAVGFSDWPLALAFKSLISTFVVLMMLCLGRRWMDWSQLGLGKPATGWARWLTVLFLLLCLALVLVHHFDPGLLPQVKYNESGTPHEVTSEWRICPPWMKGMNSHLPLGSFLLVLTSSVILAPIHQEILFRGILFQFMQSRWGYQPALWITGFCFVAVHDLWVAFATPEFVWVTHRYVVKYLLLNYGACLLLQKTRSLYPSILFHASLNLQAELSQYGDLL